MNTLVDALRRIVADAKTGEHLLETDEYEALDAAIRALSPPALDAPVVLGYIGANVAAHLREGGHAATTITGHKAMSDDVAIYASPVAAQAVTDAIPLSMLPARRDTTRDWGIEPDYDDGKDVGWNNCLDAIEALAHPNAAPCDAQGATP